MLTLQDLTGEHVLTGVDYGITKCRIYGDEVDCNDFRFVLDGVVCVAVENPEDGYRSSMGELLMGSHGDVTNRFQPQKVLCHIEDTACYGDSSEYTMLLSINNADTGKTIARVGTDDRDGCYPLFISDFYPENMTINKGA